MSNVKVTEYTNVPAPHGYDVNNYIKYVFKMYDGTMQEIELKCLTKDVVNSVIDKFGTDVGIEKNEDDDTTNIRIKVSISKTFYSWLFQFGSEIEIVSPKAVRTEYRKMCQSIVKQYK